MRPVVVAPSELADGFRLAGIPVVELEDEEKIPEVIRRIDEMRDVAIVLVDERFIDPFEKAFAGRDFPMVASYPAFEVQRDQSYIDELTLRYLGQKIYVEGESES
jgi:vacuolar-type H+-ATPase subunit F/Vma7